MTHRTNVSVGSTSNIPPASVQQNSTVGGGPAMYHVSQMPADAYNQQQMYGYATYGPPDAVYSPNEMFNNAPNTFAQVPYGYANLPPGQTDFATLTAIPPGSAQSHLPHPLNQQGNNTAPYNQQTHNQMPHSAGGPHRQQMIGHPQFPTQQLHNAPPQPRVQHFSAGFGNNGGYNPNAAFYPQVQSAQPSSSTISGPQQQGDQRAKLPPMADNAADNYTASWVSSTSSIPHDMKVPPDHNSARNSPSSEYASWGTEGNTMTNNRPNQTVPNHVYASGCGPPTSSHLNWANNTGQQQAVAGHVMQDMNAPYGYSGHNNSYMSSNFVVQADSHGSQSHSAPQHPIKNQHRRGPASGNNEPSHQFAGNGGSNQKVAPSFMFNSSQPPFLPPNAAFMFQPPYPLYNGALSYQQFMPPGGIRMPNYYQPNYPPFFQPMHIPQMPMNPLFPPDARSLSPQTERFHNSWLDQDLVPQEQMLIEQSLIPLAYTHNNSVNFARVNRTQLGIRHSTGNLLTNTYQQPRGGGFPPKRHDRKNWTPRNPAR
ncbi:hypothetical protein M3Y98_01146500 [Aphelenchoides besseyi]|nr:hypothetical protein M3Y98_01146500 [Aphelenchoides besseyi]KAI6210738.1 hypothetical protein M3Y96_00359900 [Aphelenchoides besseyi]